MTAAESPWLRIARSAAHEWFRDHPGATFGEFDTWVVEDWEPTEFFAAGFGIDINAIKKPEDLAKIPDDLQDQACEALDAAHVGLTLACEVELGRRQARDRALGRPVRHGERLGGPRAGVGQSPWWDGAQGGAA